MPRISEGLSYGVLNVYRVSCRHKRADKCHKNSNRNNSIRILPRCVNQYLPVVVPRLVVLTIQRRFFIDWTRTLPPSNITFILLILIILHLTKDFH